ncbi:MAG: tetratricopeptide repeat protein [Deltaproteobacteria bacterium]|nr:tetratricopeptide repeat protein [Deltaproteobacteria bacterium]MBW1874189.1 tetratricopeptide repeat protein [Deltaproteobacteria bacterium]MBW2210019.1 tetratricopeptide repeat protein [Deltaproteobacteria bacterium]MBW2214127.1 tetratricopeptide repeat protein [Deltaproteobacteria bacterium]MBW2377982.1 tetratricopeptide repeat protein [Deltaproteobacteria bacterium]
MKIVDGPLRRWPAPIALLIVLSAGCGSAHNAPPRPPPVEVVSRPAASPDVLRAERLLAEGKVDEAKRILEQALDADPNDARAWLDVGLAHEETGDFAAAEKSYRRATEIDGNFAEAFNNLGVLLREGGKLAEATTMLERAVALDPQLTAARFNLGLAYEEQGKLAASEREYLATIDGLPSDPVPRINLAMMLLDMGRREDAAVQLRAARPMVRGDVLLSIAVGEGFRRSGLPEEAVPVLRTALSQAPEPPPTELLAELALAYYASGDLDAAEATMRRAVAQNELDPALQYAYGSILARQGQLGKARAHLRRAAKLDPDGPYADRARARLEVLKE